MLFVSLESYGRRIEVLRARNEELRRSLDHEFSRLIVLRSHRYPKTPAPPSDPVLKELTPREMEVLGLIAEGCTTKQVATRLGMSFKTAACHRHRLMQKIGVHGTGALVRFAIANHVVNLPSQS